MITLLKIGVEAEGDRSHVLISIVGQVSTRTIRRQVYQGVVDAKSTSTDSWPTASRHVIQVGRLSVDT